MSPVAVIYFLSPLSRMHAVSSAAHAFSVRALSKLHRATNTARALIAGEIASPAARLFSR
jgi:hypothetical protein